MDRGVETMYLFAEVIFFSGQRKHLPGNGYRPDAIFNESKEYWGITFSDLPSVLSHLWRVRSKSVKEKSSPSSLR